MGITEIDYGAARPIEGYGPGFFRIGGRALPAPALIAPGIETGWGGYDDLTPLLALAGRVDVLFVGTGAALALPRPFRTALEAAGIGVEIMASPTACRTYNVLLAEGRRVAVALIGV